MEYWRELVFRQRRAGMFIKPPCGVSLSRSGAERQDQRLSLNSRKECLRIEQMFEKEMDFFKLQFERK